MTLLNPDVVRNSCWRRRAGCKIRSTTGVSNAWCRDRGRDQGQCFGVLWRRYSRRSRSDSRRGRSRERSPPRLHPKTPPMPPPRRSIRSTSTGPKESASATPCQWDSTTKRGAWPSYHRRFPMIRPGREARNRRVKVDGLPVGLLDHLYWAGHGASRDGKGRSLRWIVPYYPGPDAGARQATQIADANHESNIKICVLDEVQQNTSNAIDFSTSQMKAGMDCDRVRRHQ